jgi:hypothetical protein
MDSSRRLSVDRRGRRFHLTGTAPVCLRRRRKLQPLLAALVAQRLSRPGIPIPVEALIACGWPDERVLPRAARARLHVAISSLRQMGLGPLLRHDRGGYLLDPAAPLDVVEEGPPSTNRGAA